MLKIFTEPTDEFLKLLDKNSLPPAEPVRIYKYPDFSWWENRIFFGSKPFAGFSPADTVLFRQDRDYGGMTAFWIRTLAALAARAGAVVVNSKVWQAFPHYSDKYAQAMMFNSAGINHISTALLSDFPIGQEFFPFISKPRLGCMGRGIKIINTAAEFSSFISSIVPKDYIVQPFCKLKRDVRALVVAGRIFGAVERQVKLYPDGRIGVEVAAPTGLTRSEKILANRCIHGFGIDLMGVDLLTGQTGRTWIGEINLAPNVSGFSRATGADAAAEILTSLRSETATKG